MPQKHRYLKRRRDYTINFLEADKEGGEITLCIIHKKRFSSTEMNHIVSKLSNLYKDINIFLSICEYGIPRYRIRYKHDILHR